MTAPSSAEIWTAVRFAAQQCDGINGVDLHEAAYAIMLENGGNENDEPTSDDYATAYVRAANKEAP